MGQREDVGVLREFPPGSISIRQKVTRVPGLPAPLCRAFPEQHRSQIAHRVDLGQLRLFEPLLLPEFLFEVAEQLNALHRVGEPRSRSRFECWPPVWAGCARGFSRMIFKARRTHPIDRASALSSG